MRTALLCLVLVAGCSKPAPPTLTPERVQITGMTTSRIELELQVGATNPNSYDIPARSLTAHLVIGGKFDLGTTEIPVTTTLVAGKKTLVDVPVSVQMKDIAPLGKLAIESPTIPYTVDGIVSFGGDWAHVELPYRLDGTVQRGEVVKAALGSIPGLGGGR
jgi:LEA14-like dessication related protein